VILKKNEEEVYDIFSEVIKNDEYFKKNVGSKVSFDIGIRPFKILGRDVHVHFLNGLTDSSILIHIFSDLLQINDHEKNKYELFNIIFNRLNHQSVTTINSLEEATVQLLCGLPVIFIDGETSAIAIDIRSYPGRSPQEPDTEKVVRGARDGYTENIIVNTALTRRRIRDQKLRFKIMKIGQRSKTDVVVAFIEDIADPKLVEDITHKLESIDIDGLAMADKTVEECIVNQGYNPFPLVRYTERPDVAANHLIEGHVIVFVDTSPSVIITPTTYFHHVQHAEEYRQAPIIGTALRWFRFLGLFLSIFLLPLWLLFATDLALLPENLEYIGPKELTNIPVLIQILLADFGIEFLRMAAIHTPTPLSTAMGLIAAALIGQIAIDVGLFVPEVILYVAIAAIGSFATPSYEMGVANKVAKTGLLILAAFMGVEGFMLGVTIIFVSLVSLKSFNTPYLWPFAPFNPAAFKEIVIRTPVKTSRRLSVINPQDRVRMKKAK
jgi:stage V sporulation protein AF